MKRPRNQDEEIEEKNNTKIGCRFFMDFLCGSFIILDKQKQIEAAIIWYKRCWLPPGIVRISVLRRSFARQLKDKI